MKQKHDKPNQDQPVHPTLKANLLMGGVVLLLLVLAAASTVGAR